MKWTDFLIVPVLAITILIVAIYHYRFNQPDAAPEAVVSDIPDFKSYTNVKKKKLDFFNFMLPLVRQRADQLGQASSLRT